LAAAACELSKRLHCCPGERAGCCWGGVGSTPERHINVCSNCVSYPLDLSITSLSFLSTMAPVPNSVSNRPIPAHIYALLPSMALQLLLTRFWCTSCVSSLLTTSKNASTRSVESLREVFVRAKGYCTCCNNFGVCSRCTTSNKGGCVEVRELLSLLSNPC
jgi:hypothetical protein